MEKKFKIKTLIRKDHKLGDNVYVRGKISGIQSVMCPRKIEFGNGQNDEGFILVAECTPEQYDDFMNFVEDIYPGLCVFDYKETEGRWPKRSGKYPWGFKESE